MIQRYGDGQTATDGYVSDTLLVRDPRKFRLETLPESMSSCSGSAMSAGTRSIALAGLLACGTWVCTEPAASSVEPDWQNAADLDGEAIELAAGDRPFVALHRTARSAEPLGAVIILHGRGTHADSLEVIQPLRIGLSEAGWDTLSVQLPTVFASEDRSVWSDQSAAIRARLDAALAWLKPRDLPKLAVIALGDSAGVTVGYATPGLPPAVKALVLISVPDDFSGQAQRDALAKVDLPILDIFAERDLAPVIETAQARQQAASAAGLADYTQRTLTGARSGFRHVEGQLVAAVRAWLKRTAGAAP